jgi:uncharacterized protein (DUF1330 family)
MSKGYVLFQYNLTDAEKFTQYVPQAVGTIVANGGTILIATDDQDQREGTLPTKRTVVLEFPSKQAAIGWYESAEYRSIIGLRLAGSTNSTCVILPGFVPPGG